MAHYFCVFCPKRRIIVALILLTFLLSLCLLIALGTNQKYNQNLRKRRKISKCKLGVVVPFGGAFDELLEFVPHMNKFLNDQGIWHQIYIVNQVDEFRFNKASLMNAGFLYATSATESCDYIVIHDIDILPLNSELSYSFPSVGPVHLVASHLFPSQNSRNHYIGGIVVISKEDFVKANGMSNIYWGWGMEDNEFYVRLQEAGLAIQRPGNLSTGANNTFRHNHSTKRKRDYQKCFNQDEVGHIFDRATGLDTLQHSIISTHTLQIDNSTPVTVLNVELVCNHSLTPWCKCPKNSIQANYTKW